MVTSLTHVSSKYPTFKRSAQVQYNYNTTAVQEFFLYRSCIALVRTALPFTFTFNRNLRGKERPALNTAASTGH